MIINCGLGPIAKSESAKEVGDVIFDGFFRDVEVLCDFSVARS